MSQWARENPEAMSNIARLPQRQQPAALRAEMSKWDSDPSVEVGLLMDAIQTLKRVEQLPHVKRTRFAPSVIKCRQDLEHVLNSL